MSVSSSRLGWLGPLALSVIALLAVFRMIRLPLRSVPGRRGSWAAPARCIEGLPRWRAAVG
jgi:hypothetical protein